MDRRMAFLLVSEHYLLPGYCVYVCRGSCGNSRRVLRVDWRSTADPVRIVSLTYLLTRIQGLIPKVKVTRAPSELTRDEVVSNLRQAPCALPRREPCERGVGPDGIVGEEPVFRARNL